MTYMRKRIRMCGHIIIGTHVSIIVTKQVTTPNNINYNVQEASTHGLCLAWSI